jgi:hypothetical protein
MNTAQRELGFDEVLDPLDFPEWGGKSLTTHVISDDELGRYALQVLSRSHDRPLLLFVLSMMQHGPYSSTHPVGYGLERSNLPGAQPNRISDYLARLDATNRAAQAFGTRLLATPRPIVYAYFGDHQPNLGGLLPYDPRVTSPQFLTHYVVKTNFASPAPPLEASPLDVSYLGALILEQAGVSLNALFDANRRMRVLCEGQLSDCPDHALTASYRAHLYSDLQAAGLP